ncbi:MAG: DUF362 domain-containing protein [Thermoplasmata archaeon]
MALQFIEDLDRIEEALASGEPFIVAFSVDEANKIRRLEEFVDRLSMFAPLAGKSCFLKPNMVSSELYPTTTDPEVLRFVLNRLRGSCSRIGVADSPAQGAMDMYEHPVAKVCKDLDVEFLDLRGTRTGLMGKTPVHEYPLEFDSIVSLPILKEHFVCGMTFALKNNFGFTDRGIRMKLHMWPKKLDRVIAQLHGEYPVDLVIGDACRTMRKAQERRWGGVEDILGLFFLSNAPLELDILARKLFPKKRVRHLGFAREMYGEKDAIVWVEEGLRDLLQSE